MITTPARRCSVHLDYIRGLAALAVFVGHARGVFLVDFREISHPSLVLNAAYWATGLGHQAVMIFFVLSGYFITSSVVRAWPHWSWRDYLTDRLVRLYLVLLPGLVLTAVWDWVGRHWGCPALYEGRHPGAVFQFSAVQRSGFATFLANVVFLQTVVSPSFGTNSPLWSLCNEFWYYMLFPCLLMILSPSPPGLVAGRVLGRRGGASDLSRPGNQSVFPGLASGGGWPSPGETSSGEPMRGVQIELPRPRVVVLQDGARLHYAVPLALQSVGVLARVFTDWFVFRDSVEGMASRWLERLLPQFARKLADRGCNGLSSRCVVRSPLLFLRTRLRRRTWPSPEAFYVWQAVETGRWVRRRGFGVANGLFGFVRNLDPDLPLFARSQGLVTVGDQMCAPSATEGVEWRCQLDRWPDWETPVGGSDFELAERVEQRSWANLNHITCASDYVRDRLVEQGVDPSRVTVLPYPINLAAFPPGPVRAPSRPVTVGFLGRVGLHKGAPYFAEVARRFPSSQVRFVMVGPNVLSPRGLAQLKGLVELVGSVPRSQVRNWLRRFDIFFFPSTHEGSAGAVMEAMACGLPVVTTPNSGSVVRNGQEGFIRSYDDIDGLAWALDQLISNVALRQCMGEAARERAGEFDLAGYGARLAGLFQRLLTASTLPSIPKLTTRVDAPIRDITHGGSKP